MILRQLFDKESSTYTYLLADSETRQAVIIDPVREQAERDLELIQQLDLVLLASLETHVHADHITGADALRQATACQVGVAAIAASDAYDLHLSDGDLVHFGMHQLQVLATPGHTATCLSYYLEDPGLVFTGDALMIRRCGRTDFQEGDAGQLYDSVHGKLFSLPPDTLVYPGHDYTGQTVSTIREEVAFNPRLGGGNDREAFIGIMDGLRLSHPKKMDVAVPANLKAGAGA